MTGRSTKGGANALGPRFWSEVFGVASAVGTWFCVAGAVVGTWISGLYGGWNASLTVLVWLVVGDYITGLIASVLDGTGLSSNVGFKGIAKKVMILFLVLVGHKLDLAMQSKIVMDIVVYFYVTNELISVIENMGRMGIPVPKQLVNIINELKGKSK